MVETCLSFRLSTAKLMGVQIFKYFMVLLTDSHLVVTHHIRIWQNIKFDLKKSFFS